MTAGIIASIVFAGIVLMFVVSELRSHNAPAKRLVTLVAAWVGIFAAVYVIFLFRDDIGDVWVRAKADITGEPAMAATGGAFAIRMDADGHFWVNGATPAGSRRMLVDSGATTTVLSSSGAAELGVESSGGYPVLVDTANGTIRTYRARVPVLTVGSITVRDFPVLISENDDIDVIGMNWLSLMRSWEVRGRVLTVTPS
jgi:aspartyl protease family protein